MERDFSRGTREKLGLFYLVTSIAILGFSVYLDVTTPDAPWWYYAITAFLFLWFAAELVMLVSGARAGGVAEGLVRVSKFG